MPTTPTVTPKQVEQARSKVDKLSEQIAAEKKKLAQKQAGGETAVAKVRLDNEAERLEAQLAQLKEANKEADKALDAQVESVAASGEAPIILDGKPVEGSPTPAPAAPTGGSN